jgi:glutamate-1-semialdehyde 2,1-aminomutase
MMGLFFTDQPVKSFEDAKTSDLNRFSLYYRKMLENGIYIAPSQFEALFVSLAHKDDQIDATVEAAEKVFKSL